MQSVKITLPHPVSVNALYGTNKYTGAQYITEKGKEYKKDVINVIKEMQSDPDQAFTPFSKSTRLRCEVFLYTRTKDPMSVMAQDIDNPMKIIWDSLKSNSKIGYEGVYDDDRQFDELIVRRMGHLKGGKAVIIITALN